MKPLNGPYPRAAPSRVRDSSCSLGQPPFGVRDVGPVFGAACPHPLPGRPAPSPTKSSGRWESDPDVSSLKNPCHFYLKLVQHYSHPPEIRELRSEGEVPPTKPAGRPTDRPSLMSASMPIKTSTVERTHRKCPFSFARRNELRSCNSAKMGWTDHTLHSSAQLPSKPSQLQFRRDFAGYRCCCSQ